MSKSITDSVKRLKRRFVSVSGIITDMWYEESWKNHKCPYCFEETNESYSYNGSDNGDIVNDCKDETDTIPFDGILIPDVNSIKNLQNKACAFGIRSKDFTRYFRFYHNNDTSAQCLRNKKKEALLITVKFSNL